MTPDPESEHGEGERWLAAISYEGWAQIIQPSTTAAWEAQTGVDRVEEVVPASELTALQAQVTVLREALEQALNELRLLDDEKKLRPWSDQDRRIVFGSLAAALSSEESRWRA